MEPIIFDFLGQHRYGSAFHDYLKLRKEFFVDQLAWDIPHNDDVEMDQYDNPCARYSLVLRDGKVIGGARAMATTSTWGSHTYMMQDALRGYLETIPPGVIPLHAAKDDLWECSRLVISDSVATHAERAQCLTMIVEGLVETANREGGMELMSLSPLPLMRALRQLGYAVSQLGTAYRSETDGRKYAVLRMPAMTSAHLMAAE